MFYDAAKRDHGLAQDPLKSLIVPRPIGWISTVDKQGRVNLAPYSFYNGVSEYPPMVYFAITGTYGDTPTKHSRMNAESTGEFVVNMVSESLKEQMNVTTTMVAFGVDELKLKTAIQEKYASLIKPGQAVEFDVEAFMHRTFHGRIAYVSPAVDQATRTFAVEALVDNTDRQLKPGFFAKGVVMTRIDDEVLAVSDEAISTLAGVSTVYVIDGGKARQQQIAIGARQEGCDTLFDSMMVIRYHAVVPASPWTILQFASLAHQL